MALDPIEVKVGPKVKFCEKSQSRPTALELLFDATAFISNHGNRCCARRRNEEAPQQGMMTAGGDGKGVRHEAAGAGKQVQDHSDCVCGRYYAMSMLTLTALSAT